MPAPGSDPLADGLRQAFDRLGRLDVTDAERARLHRRLLAVTTAAKRDGPRAAERLQRFLRDIEDLPQN